MKSKQVPDVSANDTVGAAASTAASDNFDNRPTPVVLAAVLLVLSSFMSVCMRITPSGQLAGSSLWLLTIPASLLLAWGLWRLQRWAYWLMLGAIVFGLGQNLWRIFFAPEQLGLVYPLARLAALGAWTWYWQKPTVRHAFGLKPR